jgi:poly-beta-1,6-N-acetyl-D-glucosamine synthase
LPEIIIRKGLLVKGMKVPTYVLITPARNEAKYIELTLKSVSAQTVKPLKWVIVSDGSTDGTDEIVQKYAAEHAWIELVRAPERKERHFAGKVHAFNLGRSRVADLDFDIIGNLDGDVSFEADLFEYLMTKFGEDPSLGVAGAPFREGNLQYDYRFSNIENVWGGCQLFRRECFEQIGGYVPVKGGSIDHIAVVSARMKNWKTRTFTDRLCMHHRTMGTAQHSGMAARYRMGVKDYAVGNHPVWEISRVLYQMKNQPRIVGGLAMGCGYFWSLVRRVKRPVSDEFVKFTRKEQMQRLGRLLPGKKSTAKGSAQLVPTMSSNHSKGGA